MLKSVRFLIFGFVFAVAATGCKQQNNMIEKVNFKISDDLKVTRVSLIFKNNVQSNMAGGFDIQYGHFFINPFTQTQPFEIGFDLDMGVFYDQNYIGLTPTMTLPNGLPTGIPWPVVEVKNPTPIHEKFDIYGYVDVSHLSWLGVSAMFSFLNDQYFPADLSISQVFLRDNATGKPAVLASVFGPVVNPDGTIQRNGGIALFANVRQLIEQYGNAGREGISLRPEKKHRLIGRNAEHYNNPAALYQLQNSLIRGFNAN